MVTTTIHIVCVLGDQVWEGCEPEEEEEEEKEEEKEEEEEEGEHK